MSLLLILAIAGESWALQPAADGFPSQPLAILVPRAYGGASYRISAGLAEALGEVTGVQVRVYTRPDSSGLEALDAFMEMPANGYTILENQDLLFSQYLTGVIELNPTRDLVPLCVALAYSQLYARRNDARFDDLADLTRCARHKVRACPPDRPLRVALFGGTGATEDQLFSALEQALGFAAEKRFISAPEKRYLSLLQGKVDLLLEQPGDVRPFLERGLIKPVFSFRKAALAAFPKVASYATLDRQLPDLPRIRGFFVHAGTPAARLAYLRQAFVEAVRSPKVQEYAKQHYIAPQDILCDPEQLESFMDQVLATYRTLISKP